MCKRSFIVLLLPWFLLGCSEKSSNEKPQQRAHIEATRAVIQRHIKAAGGTEVFQKIGSQLSQLNVQEGAEAFTAEARFKDNDKLLLSITVPNGVEIRQGHDGQGHW